MPRDSIPVINGTSRVEAKGSFNSIFTGIIFKTLTLPMQHFGVENHHTDIDKLLLITLIQNAYENENDIIVYSNPSIDRM